MYKSLLVIFPLILGAYGCNSSSAYHKIKVTLGLEEKKSFLLEKINYNEMASSDEDMKGALKDFEKEADMDTHVAKSDAANRIMSHSENDVESDNSIEGLRRELSMLRFENERMRTELQEKNGIIFNKFESTPSRGSASIAIPATTTTDSSASDLYKIGETFLKKGKYKGAKEYFNKLISRFPEDRLTSMSYFWLGEISSIQKDYVSAVESYREAAYTSDARERKVGSYYKIAEAYKAMGRAEFSRQYYEKVINLFPESKYGERALKELTSK